MFSIQSPLTHLTQIHHIVDDPTLNLNQALTALLKLGVESLHMQVGIISHITLENDLYTVEAHYPYSAGVKRGQTFKYSLTYCEITTRLRMPVSIHHMQQSEHHRHPCYQWMHLEAYIGVPLYIHGKIYGTVNFSNPEPRSRSFDKTDRSLMIHLERAVADLIERQLRA